MSYNRISLFRLQDTGAIKVLLCVGISVLFFPLARATAATGSVSSQASSSVQEPQQMLDFNISGYGARGEKTWDVQGASMDMVGDDVKISDITAKLYGEKENMVLTADEGDFDRKTGVVHLNKNVRAVTDSGATMNTDSLDWSQKEQKVTTQDVAKIEKENITATGKGITAHPDFKVATFEENVVMTMDETKKPVESGTGRMMITCDGPMTLDYNKNVAVFEKNVRVEGDAEQGTMISDKMTVIFSPETKQINKIEAVGHVRIIREENTSESDSAVFTASDKKLILTGRPKLVLYAEEEKEENVSP